MTLLERDTIIDRPELVNRGSDEDEQDNDEEEEVERLGEGGPIVHGLEFEEGDLDVVAGANTCAFLTTGETEGDVFQQMFKNAAVQLKDMKNRQRDIEMISYFGVNNSIGTVGLPDEKSDQLMTELLAETTPEEDAIEDEDADIEEVEDEVDEITDEDE